MSQLSGPRLMFRVTPAMLSAIDAEVERWRAERPGAIVNRSDVARAVLARALRLEPAAAEPREGRAT